MSLLALGETSCMEAHRKLTLKWELGDFLWLSKETWPEVMLLPITMRCAIKVVQAELRGHFVR